jgi:glucose-6-phosphate isomerase
MLRELRGSGLPLYINEADNVLAMSAPLLYNGYGTKNAGQMRGLLADEANLDENEVCYDVYRGLRLPDDKALLDSHDVRYDITVIMGGLINGECKKTAGHYHGYNPEHTHSYAEVYEVIKGTVLFVLQRADNFDGNPGDLKVDDIIFAVVKEGESIVIPPNYGHCSYNISVSGPGIFGSFAYVPCTIAYDPVKHYHGMGYYIKKAEGDTDAVPNGRYKNLPAPKFARVRENPKLGIQFGLPVYNSFKRNPDAFAFLEKPAQYFDEILSMLDMKNTLQEALK